MSAFKNAYLENEIKRWMAPNAHHFVHPDWRRYVQADSDLRPVFELYESKYNQNQPRVPAGSREGGQWTGPDGVGNSIRQTRIAARISASRAQACEIQRRQDEFICKSVQRASCYAQAMLRYANCLQGLPIPPLFF